MALVKTGQAVTPVFTVTNPAGGGLVNADALPTGVVYVDGVADAATVTVTNLAAGKYKAAVTLPAMSAGATWSLLITATVGGSVYADVVMDGIGDTVRLSEIAGYLDNEIASIIASIAALNDLSSAEVEALIADGAGATPATFWGYTGPGGRTLSQSMIAILSSMIEGSAITITRGDNVSVSITGLGPLTDYTGLWFTVKARPASDTDAQAKIQITKAAGLIRLNGAAADDSADGAITIDDLVDGDITITLSAAAAAQLGTGAAWRWDVQVAQPGPGVWTPRAGVFMVVEDVTRAVG